MLCPDSAENGLDELFSKPTLEPRGGHTVGTSNELVNSGTVFYPANYPKPDYEIEKYVSIGLTDLINNCYFVVLSVLIVSLYVNLAVYLQCQV